MVIRSQLRQLLKIFHPDGHRRIEMRRDFHASDTNGLMKERPKFLKANEDFTKVFPSLNNLLKNGNLYFKPLIAVIKAYSTTKYPF